MDQDQVKQQNDNQKGGSAAEPLAVYDDTGSYDEMMARGRKPVFAEKMFGPKNVRNLVVLLLVGGVSFMGVREYMRRSTLDDRTSATNKTEILNVDQSGGQNLLITTPDEGGRVSVNQNLLVSVAIKAGVNVDEVRFFVDGVMHCERRDPPYSCEVAIFGEEGQEFEIGAEALFGSESRGVDTVRVVGVK